MVVVMSATASARQIQGVLAFIARHGLAVRLSRGVERTIIVVIDEAPPGLAEELATHRGVERVVPIARPYKLASREYQPHDSHVRIGDAEFGGAAVLLIAGTARLPDLNSLSAATDAARRAGAHALRVPAFAEALSAYAPPPSQAPAAEALSRARRAGLPILAQVRSAEDVDACALLADAFWVGGHDMHNASLLRRCVAARRPLVLERSPAATVDDWLIAAEQILASGHEELLLCEGGIRSIAQRTLDLNAVPLVRLLSHLPIITEPGSATTSPEMLEPLALASAAAGAHGVAIEVTPPKAPAVPGDEPSLSPAALRRLARRLARLSRARTRL